MARWTPRDDALDRRRGALGGVRAMQVRVAVDGTAAGSGKQSREDKNGTAESHASLDGVCSNTVPEFH
jgi:hypothetical protein